MIRKQHEPIKAFLKGEDISVKYDNRKLYYTESEDCRQKLRLNAITKQPYFRHFITGSSYFGTWTPVDMEGYGEYTFPHGVLYEGDMKDGQFHGEGKLTYPMGQSIRGIFRNGEMLSWEFSFGYGQVCSLENYCKFPDRRYMSTIKHSFLPPGEERITQRHPERPIPEGHYDVEDGFYNPKTKWIYSAQSMQKDKEPVLKRMALKTVKPIDTKVYLPDGSSFIRKLPFVPVYQDEEFIKKHCRKAWDEPVGYRPDLYEKWMSGRAEEAERYRRKFITKNTVDESDSNCIKLLDFFRKIAEGRRNTPDI